VIRESKNLIPVSMAVLLHVVIFTTMIVAFDYAQPTPFTPLAVQATLVTEVPERAPPPPPVREPEPEPEPVIEEPEPEPDNSEELRRQAEEEKRRLDALLEQQRLDDLKKKEAEEKKRKEREEEDKERKRVEAEKKRQDDIRRQREENERLRRELEAEQRQSEIDAETDRMAAVDAGELAVYTAMIQQKIYRNLNLPASAADDMKCSVRVRQARSGDVLGITFLGCEVDDAVKRSIEAAVFKSSPLPDPPTPNLFDPNILLNLTKQQ